MCGGRRGADAQGSDGLWGRVHARAGRTRMHKRLGVAPACENPSQLIPPRPPACPPLARSRARARARLLGVERRRARWRACGAGAHVHTLAQHAAALLHELGQPRDRLHAARVAGARQSGQRAERGGQRGRRGRGRGRGCRGRRPLLRCARVLRLLLLEMVLLVRRYVRGRPRHGGWPQRVLVRLRRGQVVLRRSGAVRGAGCWRVLQAACERPGLVACTAAAAAAAARVGAGAAAAIWAGRWRRGVLPRLHPAVRGGAGAELTGAASRAFTVTPLACRPLNPPNKGWQLAGGRSASRSDPHKRL